MKLFSTKSRILKAALEILESKGIQELTQPAVSKLVGIPQGQLTYHFKKRADLVMAVTEAVLDSISDTLFQSEIRKLRDKGEFGPILKIILSFIQSRPRARALFGLMLEADSNPEIREKILAQGTKAREIIAKGLQKKIEDDSVTQMHATLIGFASG
jgi:AcrR family transcriptional regulator